ncbi:hypothetical protein CNEO4_1670015 [Clostridium neonatale]|nr:hypothetical protein CNEO4_1670015 [Clostridium neonatale]
MINTLLALFLVIMKTLPSINYLAQEKLIIVILSALLYVLNVGLILLKLINVKYKKQIYVHNNNKYLIKSSNRMH